MFRNDPPHLIYPPALMKNPQNVRIPLKEQVAACSHFTKETIQNTIRKTIRKLQRAVESARNYKISSESSIIDVLDGSRSCTNFGKNYELLLCFWPKELPNCSFYL